MVSDGNAEFGRTRWAGLRSRRLRNEDVGPTAPEPKVWENAGELLAQEFQPLHHEPIFGLK